MEGVFSEGRHLKSRQLRYFLAVYDYLNLSVAADRVHVTQPALSKSIQALESSLGVPLFERRPHGLHPTRYADILVRHARRMDMEYQHALAEISNASGGSEGLLRIGAGPIWYSKILPDIFSVFLKENPVSRIRIQSGVISTLVPQLLAGQIDLICVTLDFPAQAGLIREPVMTVSNTIVAHVSHPLHQNRSGTAVASPAGLGKYSWIVLADDQVGSGRILSYFAANEMPPPHFVIETSSPTHMFENLTRGPYLAQIPQQMMGLAHRYDLKEIPIAGAFWSAEAGVCYRQTDCPSPQLSRMLAAIRNIALQ